MAVIFAKAPGKAILFGEHAVVYGQPAIAIPVTQVQATARVYPNIASDPGNVHIQAPDIRLDAWLSDLPENHPLVAAVNNTLQMITPSHTPSFTIQISSTIPVSAGMGSSAAISIAVIKALSAFLGNPLPEPEVSDLAYEVEKLHHGTPSGIDNHVIAYQKPMYYLHNQPITFLHVNRPTHWVIADTGEKTSTRNAVAAVRALYDSDPEHYGSIFKAIGSITREAKDALINGDLSELGRLLNENQRLLEDLTVSSDGLNRLIDTARASGAAGAKLSGGGRGGTMIALAPFEKLTAIEEALLEAGAARVITTVLTEDPIK